MTETEIKQVRYIRSEIAMYRGKLLELRQRSMAGGGKLDGMPRSGKQGDKVSERAITAADLERYPELDVRRELIRAVNWCKDNPEKLKPRSGAWRFVTGWLTRAEKDREAAEAAPVVVRSAAAKNSFHNFEEREDTHLDDLFPGDIVNAEVG